MRISNQSAMFYENTARATQNFALNAARAVNDQTKAGSGAVAAESSDVSISLAGRKVYDLIALSPTLRQMVPNFYPNAVDHNGRLADIAAREIVAQAQAEGISLNVATVERAIRDQFGIRDQAGGLYDRLDNADRQRFAELGEGLEGEDRNQLARVAIQFNRDKAVDPSLAVDPAYLTALSQRAQVGNASGVKPEFVGNLLGRVNAITPS